MLRHSTIANWQGMEMRELTPVKETFLKLLRIAIEYIPSGFPCQLP